MPWPMAVQTVTAHLASTIASRRILIDKSQDFSSEATYLAPFDSAS